MAGMEVAVASGILKIVSNKLAPLLMKEYSSIVGAKEDLQELHGQILEINKWLERGDKAVGNDPSFYWLKQLKDIAYDVDDIVDEFQLKAEKHDAGRDSGIMAKYVCTKPKSIMFQCKAASKIKAIKKKFASVVKQRNDFSAITNSLPVGHLVRHMNLTVGEMPLLPNIDAASVLGRDKEKHLIISKIVQANDQHSIGIVSVIGLGGSGKTTLAKLVFNDDNIVKKHFEVKLWVHVSQEFDVAKLVEKLFEAIAGEKSERYPLQQMSKTISDKLTGKRYLLVLDDVWTEDQLQWDQFMVHLKNGTPGSGILLTTRSRKVAEAVRSRYQFDLPFLSLDDACQLFQQSLIMPVKGLEPKFVEVGKEIVRKCGGVPLAIKVLAGVLHDKERIEEWEAIRDNNLLDVEGEGQNISVSACLRLSYFHLPSYLKQCFTLCSLFPKGYWIDKEQLIDQWIAHDMINVPGVDNLEYIGHKFFNSLVQVSFLQDVEEFCGRVRCQMHDLVHDLARSILGNEISLVVPKEATILSKSYRYFSLINHPRNLQPKNIFGKARALYVKKGDIIIFGKELKNAKHLRSIAMECVYTKSVPTAILQVKNLRYLRMSHMYFETLPEAISDVWSLQGLHITVCLYLLKLPESIGKLQRLRTLNLSACENLMSLPDSVGDCNMISSLDLSCCKRIPALPNSIGRNKKLRELRLRSTEIERLPSSVTTLGNLELLDLRWCCKILELPEGIGNLKNLQVLNTRGCDNLRGMPVGIGQLSRLQNLHTFVVGKGKKSAEIYELTNVARISENLIIRGIANVIDPDKACRTCLKQKANLQTLELDWRTNDEDKVNAQTEHAVLNGLEPPSGIRNLHIAGYAGGKYAQWMLNQVGAGEQGLHQFPFLTVLRLSDFPNMKHLEGLVELPCLEHLELSRLTSLEGIHGGPFPSLMKLVMDGLPRLEEVWMVTEMNLCNEKGKMQIGTCLSDIHIMGCPKLLVKPYFPSSLQRLLLEGSNEQLMQPSGQGQDQGSSSSSSFPSSFSFSHLKELTLRKMVVSSSPSPSPPTLGLESGRGWMLLQQMTALESLEILKCNGLTELPESMRRLTSLQSLNIYSCSTLGMLPEWLQELQSLQKLSITYCHSLTSLPQSMGQILSLQQMIIDSCDSLSSIPQSVDQLCSLQEMIIYRCSTVNSLPQSFDRLCSLQKLTIGGYTSMESLPQSLGHIISLKRLVIGWCTKLRLLPESLGELRSLQRLEITGLDALTCLPQSMCHLSSLEELSISCCPLLTSLPEQIQDLTALQTLGINNCPDLKKRYDRNMVDWHLIAHIPRVYINGY